MGVFENIYNAGSDVFGYDSTADNAREEQLAKAKQVAQQQQSQLASENRGLEVGQYDSPAISQCVNWGGFSHDDIYKTNQESIDQGRVGEVAGAWVKLANKLRERGEKYSKEIGDIVRGGWQGEAADKAAEVGKPAAEWMVRSADAFEATGNNLNAAGDAAGKSKQMVPKPEGFSWGETAAAVIRMRDKALSNVRGPTNAARISRNSGAKLIHTHCRPSSLSSGLSPSGLAGPACVS